MKSWFLKGTLAAAFVLPVLSGPAWAGESEDLGCSNATLQGDYAFSVVGIPTDDPAVVVGLGTFNSKGGFKQVDYPGDDFPNLGTTFRGPQSGSYSVNPNCTGFMTINLGVGVGFVENALVISDGGRSIHAVVAGFFPNGATQPPVPVQSSVTFWKVASEQDN